MHTISNKIAIGLYAPYAQITENHKFIERRKRIRMKLRILNPIFNFIKKMNTKPRTKCPTYDVLNRNLKRELHCY